MHQFNICDTMFLEDHFHSSKDFVSHILNLGISVGAFVVNNSIKTHGVKNVVKNA
jgi:hypothetical protein